MTCIHADARCVRNDVRNLWPVLAAHSPSCRCGHHHHANHHDRSLWTKVKTLCIYRNNSASCSHCSLQRVLQVPFSSYILQMLRQGMADLHLRSFLYLTGQNHVLMMYYSTPANLLMILI